MSTTTSAGTSWASQHRAAGRAIESAGGEVPTWLLHNWALPTDERRAERQVRNHRTQQVAA